MMRLVIYLTLVALCWQFELTNSRTSTLWKLNTESGKITGHISATGAQMDGTMLEELGMPSFDASADVYTHDEVFYIIASTLALGASRTFGGSSIGPTDSWDNNSRGGYGWVRESPENSLESLMTTTKRSNDSVGNRGGRSMAMNENKKSATAGGGASAARTDTALILEESLECKPTNYTFYDYVLGAGNRVIKHQIVPEPEVAYIFLKNKDENTFKNFDITVLERRLKRARRDRPRSAQVYNQIGQYWRIVGDTRRATDCFRCALALAPLSGEILLNIARVMYNLQYLEDAIQFARRSMEVQPDGPEAWKQYFTLGEIFKTYGHFQESLYNLRQALILYPEHEPILKALNGMEIPSSPTLHVYTVVIIVALVIAVFVVIFTSSGSGEAIGLQSEYEPKTQRHFNRAMAMRSLKGFSSSRNFRHRRN